MGKVCCTAPILCAGGADGDSNTVALVSNAIGQASTNIAAFFSSVTLS